MSVTGQTVNIGCNYYIILDVSKRNLYRNMLLLVGLGQHDPNILSPKIFFGGRLTDFQCLTQMYTYNTHNTTDQRILCFNFTSEFTSELII